MPYYIRFSEAAIKGLSRHQVEMEEEEKATHSKPKPNGAISKPKPNLMLESKWIIFKTGSSSRLFPTHFIDKRTETNSGYMTRPSLCANYYFRGRGC